MHEDNKKRVKFGLEVLLLFIGVALGIGAAIGCFNYATLAKQAGKPDGTFWVIGLVNVVYWVVMAIRYGKKIHKTIE